MPNFSTASKVLDTIRAGDTVEYERGKNRVQINKAANNEPLLPDDEAEKAGMLIFNRWGEFMITLANASRQFLTNFTSQDTYFTVTVPKAPEEQRAEMGAFITEAINELMKEGDRQMEYFMVHFSKWKAVACHGIGPMLWDDPYSWVPRTVAIEDLRVATDTEISFRNLNWFGIRIPYTPGELSRKAYSKAKGKWTWNKGAVAKLLQNVEECNFTMATNNYNWDSEPEKFEELRKQNASYWDGDAMPTINLWHFYFENENKKWELRLVPDITSSTSGSVTLDDFVCKSDGPIADKWSHILHCQFGDLNNKTPLLFHSVRSLGFALFEPCYWTDFMRCRLVQHTLDQFNILLRVTDPVDKARKQIQVFQNLGIVNPGVSFVPNTERWSVDSKLVEGTMSQTKQLQGEMSTAYTQSIDNGTQREQTAFETGVKVQQNNAMLSGIMLLAGKFEKTACKEICRRFCLDGTDDEDAKEFQKMFEAEGYDKAWLDVKKWRIEVNTPLGGGNPTMAMVEAENAMQLRPMLDPIAQNDALFEAAVQKVGSRRAKAWIKRSSSSVSPAAQSAANAFPLMMMRLPPLIPEGTNPIQQIQTLLGLSGGYIAGIEQTTKVPNQMELAGLQNVSAYIAKLVGGMKGDQGNAPLFKQFSHELSQLNNEIKKLANALNVQMQKQQEQNGAEKAAETQAKIQQIQATTAAKLQGKQAEGAQKLALKEAAERQKMRHKDINLVGDQKRKDVATIAEAGRKSLNGSMDEE